MVSTAIISLMRLGDITNNFPVARDIFLRTGEKPDWYVNLHYASLFGGIGYCSPVKVQFAPDRSDLAVDLAQKKHATVLMMQTFGKRWHGKATPCCYNRLAWTHVGYGDKFDDVENYPLVFDRRDPSREARLVSRTLTSDNKPVLLLSLSCGRSSPFAAHHAFTYSIRRKWSAHFQIIDLCNVRAARAYDVLALLEKAALLITGDSFCVHLAAAVQKLPVIFLCNDQPFLASDTRCNCVLRLKYSEWHGRIKEVHQTVSRYLQ